MSEPTFEPILPLAAVTMASEIPLPPMLLEDGVSEVDARDIGAGFQLTEIVAPEGPWAFKQAALWRIRLFDPATDERTMVVPNELDEYVGPPAGGGRGWRIAWDGEVSVGGTLRVVVEILLEAGEVRLRLVEVVNGTNLAVHAVFFPVFELRPTQTEDPAAERMAWPFKEGLMVSDPTEYFNDPVWYSGLYFLTNDIDELGGRVLANPFLEFNDGLVVSSLFCGAQIAGYWNQDTKQGLAIHTTDTVGWSKAFSFGSRGDATLIGLVTYPPHHREVGNAQPFGWDYDFRLCPVSGGYQAVSERYRDWVTNSDAHWITDRPTHDQVGGISPFLRNDITMMAEINVIPGPGSPGDPGYADRSVDLTPDYATSLAQLKAYMPEARISPFIYSWHVYGAPMSWPDWVGKPGFAQMMTDLQAAGLEQPALYIYKEAWGTDDAEWPLIRDAHGVINSAGEYRGIDDAVLTGVPLGLLSFEDSAILDILEARYASLMSSFGPIALYIDVQFEFESPDYSPRSAEGGPGTAWNLSRVEATKRFRNVLQAANPNGYIICEDAFELPIAGVDVYFSKFFEAVQFGAAVPMFQEIYGDRVLMHFGTLFRNLATDRGDLQTEADLGNALYAFHAGGLVSISNQSFAGDFVELAPGTPAGADLPTNQKAKLDFFRHHAAWDGLELTRRYRLRGRRRRNLEGSFLDSVETTGSSVTAFIANKVHASVFSSPEAPGRLGIFVSTGSATDQTFNLLMNAEQYPELGTGPYEIVAIDQAGAEMTLATITDGIVDRVLNVPARRTGFLELRPAEE